MNVILWIIFGGLAGWIASLIVQGSGLGLLWDIIIGIVGALLGGWIADQLGVGGEPGAERPTGVWSFVTAVLGAVILLLILNWIF